MRDTKLAPLAPVADRLAFNNLGRLRRCRAPVQLVHGTADRVAPFSGALALHRCLGERHALCPAWIEGGSHLGIEGSQATRARS